MYSPFKAFLLYNKIILIGICLVALNVFITSSFGLGFKCQYEILFGSKCESCGLTRGLYHFFTLNFKTAHDFNSRSTYIGTIIVFQTLLKTSMISVKPLKLFINKHLTTFVVFEIITLILLITLNFALYG